MSQEIAVFLTHPVTFSYHYKPITYVTLSQVPKKKKIPFHVDISHPRTAPPLQVALLDLSPRTGICCLSVARISAEPLCACTADHQPLYHYKLKTYFS